MHLQFTLATVCLGLEIKLPRFLEILKEFTVVRDYDFLENQGKLVYVCSKGKTLSMVLPLIPILLVSVCLPFLPFCLSFSSIYLQFPPSSHLFISYLPKYQSPVQLKFHSKYISFVCNKTLDIHPRIAG